KQEAMTAGRYAEELQARAKAPARAGFVEVTAQRRDGGVHYMIKDPGPGFAWRTYINADPSRAGSSCGRGVARAAILFDKLAYSPEGNVVAAFVGGKTETW